MFIKKIKSILNFLLLLFFFLKVWSPFSWLWKSFGLWVLLICFLAVHLVCYFFNEYNLEKNFRKIFLGIRKPKVSWNVFDQFKWSNNSAKNYVLFFKFSKTVIFQKKIFETLRWQLRDWFLWHFDYKYRYTHPVIL